MLEVMRLRRFLAWSGLALLLLVAGAVLWVWNTDLGRFDSRIETAVSDALGRELRTGRLSLKLGETVRVRAGDVTLANPDWAPEPILLRVRNLEADVVFRSLFDDGPIRISRLLADGIELNAFRDDAGRDSFQFQLAGSDAPPPNRSKETAPLPVRILQGRVSDARLQLVDAQRDFPIRAVIDSLALGETTDAMLDLRLAGDLNGRPMRFDGMFGPAQALFNGGAFEFNAEGAFDTLTVTGDGRVDDLFAPDRPDFSLRVHGPDIRDVEQLIGLNPSGPGAYALHFEGTPEADRLHVTMDGNIGAFQVDLISESDGLQSLDGVLIDLHLSGPNLQIPLRLFGVDAVPPEPFEMLGVVRREGVSLSFENVSSVIGETTFDLNGHVQDFTNFRESRLRLDIAGPDIARFRTLLGIPGIAEGPFSVYAELEPTPQGLGVVQGRIESSLGSFQLSGIIGDQPGYVGTEATIALNGPDAKMLLDALGVKGFRPEPFTLEGEFAVEDNAIRLRTARLDGVLAARLEANGRIGYDFFSPVTSLDLHLTGDDIGKTLRYHVEKVPPWRGAFDVRTRLRATTAGLRFDAVDATIEGSTLQGDALIPLNADLEGLDVTFEAAGPDLELILADTMDFDVPAVAWAASAHVRRLGTKLFLEDLNLRVAQTTVTGDLDLPWPTDLGTGTFDLKAKGPDLSRVMPRIDKFQPSPVPFELSLDGSVKDDSWRFEPSWFSVGQARFDLAGTFDELPDFSATDLSIQASLPDLSRLGSWAAVPLPAIPISLDTRLTGATNDLLFEAIQLSFADSRIEGSYRYTVSGPKPFVGVNLVSERIDLRPLSSPPVQNGVSPAPREDGRLIPDLDLPLEALARRDAELDIRIDEFQTHKRIVDNVEIKATVRNGALALERYRTSGMMGSVSASGKLTPQVNGPATLSLNIDATDLAPIRETWQNADPATLPQINAAARLTSRGNDLRTIAANLNGAGAFYATEGTLPGEGLSALHLGVTDIILGVLGAADEARRPTELKCFAGRVQAKNGIFTTEPIASLKSDRLLVLASGSINLQDERLDLGFEVIPSKLLSVNLTELTNSLIRIRGTLASPAVEIDPAGTLVYGGAAVATAGLSIIAKGLFDRLRRSSEPCQRLREAVIEEGPAWNDGGRPG